MAAKYSWLIGFLAAKPGRALSCFSGACLALLKDERLSGILETVVVVVGGGGGGGEIGCAVKLLLSGSWLGLATWVLCDVSGVVLLAR